MAAPIQWPKKTRDLQDAVMDSARWDHFDVREGDIFVVTPGKSGNTWTQQIVAQLLFGGEAGVAPLRRSAWLEFRLAPLEETLQRLEAQTHRRVLKTHMPVDAIGISPKAKYLSVMRDARDVAWSLYNHYVNFTPEVIERFNNLPGRVGPPLEPVTVDVRAFYHDFLERDGYPLREFWHFIGSWWSVRHLPNVMFIHFNNLKADMPREIRKISDFLDIAIEETNWSRIVEHCSFDYMRSLMADDEMMRFVFKHGGKTFINKGTNGRWRDVLSSEEIAKADEIAAQHLAPACAHWLATGDITALD